MKVKRTTIKSFLELTLWVIRFELRTTPKVFISYTFARILTNITPIALSFSAAQIVNSLVFNLNSSINTFSPSLVTWLVLLFLSYIADSMSNNYVNYAEIRIQYEWDLYAWPLYIKRASEIDFQYVESPDFNIFSQKAAEAMNWRAVNYIKRFSELIGAIVGLLLLIGIFISINIFFVFLVLTPIILNFLINKKYGRDIYAFWDSNGDVKVHSFYAQHALENKDVLREAKIYGFTDFIKDRFALSQAKFVKIQTRKTNKKYLALSGASILNDSIFISIQLYLIFQVLSKFLKIGDYTFYISNLSTTSKAFASIENSISSMLEYSLYVKELKKYFELPAIIEKPIDGFDLPNKSPSIEFKNVTFKYPNSDLPILKNISFKIEPGETIALVGENGAGKTTLIKLLARFYDVTEGEILVNGINIKKLNIKSYYKLWGILFQSFAKMWFTVGENIGIGNIDFMKNQEMIENAALKANAKDFVSKLKHKYNNFLTNDLKDGVDLSGGQWQKLGIARSMFALPKLIVLDEPTSALDSLAEAEVFNQINQLANDITVIIVSHRFATVRQAQKILVLEGGTMTEIGSHDELIQLGGLYHKMFSTQAQGYK